jgi:HlyD family secretion protein
MIKNWPLLLGLALSVGNAGCRARSTTPPGYQGVVEYDERIVSFEVPGRIVEVKVKEGDVVKDGDVLARLDDSLQRLSKDARESEVKIAEADLALLTAGARSEDISALAARVKATKDTEEFLATSAKRAHGLLQTGSLALSDVEKTDSDLARTSNERRSLESQLAALLHGARPQEVERMKARVAAANVAVGLESEKLDRYTVKAKVPGTVLEKHVDPGELAAAGTPVVTVADTAHPFVDVFVPEGEIAGMAVGAKATVRTDALGPSLAGAVEHVERRTEFTPRFLFSDRERPNLVVRVRVRVDDPEKKLHAGVPAFVEVAR